MTTHNQTEAAPEAQAGGHQAGDHQAGGDLFNTAAGWVLFAAGLGLGLSILSGKYFHGDDPQRPEQLGYVIEGVVEESGPAAEMTMAEALNLAGVDAAAGEKVFAKCSACHSIEAGGANGVGPNLNAIMGADIAAKGGFAYSDALAGKDGQWTWDEMNAWLKSPKSYAAGTKMSFAGLSKIEDRAAVALYMNTFGSNLPVPEFAAAAAPEGEAAEGEEGAESAEDAAEAAPEAEATPEAAPEAAAAE